MIMTAQETPFTKTGCPICQMTPGEVMRYLQGGYEPPVQRAIAAHVQYCNACAAEVERVRALQQVGYHVMLTNLYDPDEVSERGHLTEATLAAFIEEALPEAERRDVAGHLASCHVCYQHYARALHDLHTPVSAADRAPREALAQVLLPSGRSAADRTPVTARWKGIERRLQTAWERIERWSEEVLGGPMRAPALALAVATVVLLLVVPMFGGTQVISLEEVQNAIANPDQVMSGRLPGITLHNEVLVLASGEDKVVFTWPAVEERPVSNYRVGLYDGQNQKVLEADVTENRWTLDPKMLEPGQRYTLNVVAFYEGGGVRPVIRGQKIRLAE
ncbi:MAG: hypothetical protein KatS3mg042_0430 [Rhodothermaceae bacterium]|nr:MAG: hypothetical protein KatS3mg042_0430 [Rhodothermaceae bacterium]